MQVSCTFPLPVYEQIREFWFKERYPNRNAAIRALLEGGLEAYKQGLLIPSSPMREESGPAE